MENLKKEIMNLVRQGNSLFEITKQTNIFLDFLKTQERKIIIKAKLKEGWKLWIVQVYYEHNNPCQTPSIDGYLVPLHLYNQYNLENFPKYIHYKDENGYFTESYIFQDEICGKHIRSISNINKREIITLDHEELEFVFKEI